MFNKFSRSFVKKHVNNNKFFNINRILKTYEKYNNSVTGYQ